MTTTTQPCSMAFPQGASLWRSALYADVLSFTQNIIVWLDCPWRPCGECRDARMWRRQRHLTARAAAGIDGGRCGLPFLPARADRDRRDASDRAAGGLIFTLIGFSGRPGVRIGACGRRGLARASGQGAGRLARVCYVIVGILLGAVVTPETLKGFTTWPASIALLMVRFDRA